MASYRCNCCGKEELWNDGWAWYGSYRDLENQGMKNAEPVLFMCSSLCRIKMVAAGQLPDVGLDDMGNVVE
jgi:hypothetical protein